MTGKGDWRVNVDIDPGPPVLMELLTFRCTGPGERDALFTRITDNLPLHRGDRLNHAAYDESQRRFAADRSHLRISRCEVDTQRAHRRSRRTHKAGISLEMQTGERYRFGATHIEQHRRQ